MDTSSGLSGLSQRFLKELGRILAPEGFRQNFTDVHTVTIPARSPDVGDITIRLDPGEITIIVGKLHHCHFTVSTQTASTPDEREREAARNAAIYVGDVIADRVHFQIFFRGGRCLGAISFYADSSARENPFPAADEIREYVWSHRIL